MGQKAEKTQQASEAFMKETIQRNQTGRGKPVSYSQSEVELNSGPPRANPAVSGRTEFEPVTRACCN